jgi:hypothetical protein
MLKLVAQPVKQIGEDHTDEPRKQPQHNGALRHSWTHADIRLLFCPT